MSFIRYQYNKQKAKENKLSPIIDELLIKFIFDEEDTYSESEIYNDFTDKLGKLNKSTLNLITQRLIKCKNSFNFKVNEPYNKLIRALDIENHIEKKLDFTNQFVKMKGIQELTSLSISASESKIIPFTYSGNNQLRKESRSSYIRLSKNDPFKYFDETKEALNSWDHINLLKNLMSIENTVIPNFSKWISYSKNNSIISFSIKMCSHFKQKESIPTLIDFLKNENHELRAEAIKALGDLQALECENHLKEIYVNQPDICQVEIIRTLGKFHSGNSLDFLRQAYMESLQTDTKKVIAEAIINYGESGKQVFNNLEQTESGFSNLILKHIANPLIKFK